MNNLKQSRLSFTAPRTPARRVSSAVTHVPELPMAVQDSSLLPLNLLSPRSNPQLSATSHKDGSYAVNSTDEIVALAAAQVDKVLKPLAKLLSGRLSVKTSQMMARDANDLSRLLLTFFSPASRKVLKILHAGNWPNEEEIAGMVRVADLVDSKLKGGYLCLGEANEADGGNILKAGSKVLYIGKGTGNKGGLGLRVTGQHTNQRHRLANPSLHYKLTYGDPNFARCKDQSLPREEKATYFVLFELPPDVPEEIICLCESFAITFARACVGPVYKSFLASTNAASSLPEQNFEGANIYTGLESFGFTGMTTTVGNNAGPSNVSEAKIVAELSEEEKLYYGSFVQRGGFACNAAMRANNRARVSEAFSMTVSWSREQPYLYLPRLAANDKVKLYFATLPFFKALDITSKQGRATFKKKFTKVIATFTFKTGEISEKPQDWIIKFDFVDEKGKGSQILEIDPQDTAVLSQTQIVHLQRYISSMRVQST
ncbi:hypothetical protein P389DRAFT_52498 [Cystobasidium minutum MCA 4210]|uniref:uncharacterized protein n=1 Tax=Cystobasidium minutum MCA 4210 TaxID=1397322 RepID=UPI0034CD1A0D|eukprot:jgi/Rhomi1/52498/CE52497_553